MEDSSSYPIKAPNSDGSKPLASIGVFEPRVSIESATCLVCSHYVRLTAFRTANHAQDRLFLAVTAYRVVSHRLAGRHRRPYLITSLRNLSRTENGYQHSNAFNGGHSHFHPG